jgi:regulatory protein YycI of two-component signal transduction system YycFG
MDWSKAKTILIVALLFANAILGYFVFTDKGAPDYSVQAVFVDEATELLLRKNIELEAVIPDNPKSLLGITVEYEMNEPFYINSRYFEGKGIREILQEGKEQLYRGSELVTIDNGKLLRYENNRTITASPRTTLEEAEQNARDFLMEREYGTDDLKLTFWSETKDGYYLEFSKFIEDSYVELGYTSFNITGETVKSMERIWLNTLDLQQSNLTIVPASKAILELLSIKEAYNKKIIDIYLCYYFDPVEQSSYDGYQQATQGNAVPAWRVQFNDGTKIVLDSE